MEVAILILVATLAGLAIASWLHMAARIGLMERKLNALLSYHGIDAAEGPTLSDRVNQMSDRVKLLADDPSQKIRAIMVYREETGAGLAEAKEVVEAYISSKES